MVVDLLKANKGNNHFMGMTGECKTFFFEVPLGGGGGKKESAASAACLLLLLLFPPFFLFADSLLKEIRFPVGKGGGWVLRKGGRGNSFPCGVSIAQKEEQK